jgi:hypothetical protein
MRLLCWCLFLAVAVVFAPVGTVARVTPLSPLLVDAPPLAADDGASAIFDAMLAIARAKATYPAGAAAAAGPYATALQRYYAGDRNGAYTNALQAIAVTSHRPYPEPSVWGSPSPTVPATWPMPELVDVAQAQAESVLSAGRRALISCGTSDPALLQALRQRYSAAVAENLRHEYVQVEADARTIIDACAVGPASAPAPSSTPTAR